MKKSTKFIAFLMLLGAGMFAQNATFSWTPTSPCPGQTVQATNTSTTPYTASGYSLTGATQSSYAVANPVITFTASGTQTVVLVIFNGVTPVGSATNIITVLPAPTITASSSQSTAACPGSTAVLTAGGGTAYAWVTPLTSTLATASITVPAQNTTYSVVGTGTNGCVATGTVQQLVTPNPVSITATSNTLCSGSSATLTASGGTAYTWQAPLTSTVAAAVISPSAVGNPTYTVTSTGTTCPSYTWTSAITVTVTSCAGIQQISGKEVSFNVYPNPTSGDVTVEFVNGTAKTIEVLDLTGRVVLTSKTSDDKATLNLKSLSNGMYYVRIQSNNSIEVTRIIKN